MRAKGNKFVQEEQETFDIVEILCYNLFWVTFCIFNKLLSYQFLVTFTPSLIAHESF